MIDDLMKQDQALEKLSFLDKVLMFENEMKKQPFAELKNEFVTSEDIGKQVGLLVKHHLSYGLYGRELFIPKGTLLTGEMHKYPQMNVLLKGDLAVLVNNEIIRILAPQIICSPAGTKRIGYAYADTIWLTIHATELTDLDEIEGKFIAKTEQEFLEFVNEQKRLPLFEDVPDFDVAALQALRHNKSGY